MLKKKYDIVYSLGTDCACSMYMLRHHLRSKSGPFDWLTHASFKTRMELILNEFQDFINLEDLRFLPKDEKMFNDEKCDYYENTRNSFYYYHDFPKDIPLSSSYTEVRAKYDRRIERFLNDITENDNVLLLWLAHNQKVDNQMAQDFCAQLRQKYNSNLNFLIIEHDETKTNGEIEELTLTPYLTKYKLYTAAFDENHIPLTLGNIQNCNKIFSKIKCQGKTTRWLKQKLKKYLIKTICIFIPYRPWRKKIKSTL